MSFEEKFTWVSLVVFAVVPGAYLVFVLGQLGGVPVAEIAYQVPMVVAIGVSVVLTVAGTIAMGVGTGIAIELSGEGSTDEIGRTDERDTAIGRHGDRLGSYAAAVGALVALVFAMLRFDQFWIANVLYVSFVASSITSAAVKLVAYRRGF